MTSTTYSNAHNIYPWNFARLLVDTVDKTLGVFATLFVCFGPCAAVRAVPREATPPLFLAPPVMETEAVVRPVRYTRVSFLAQLLKRESSFSGTSPSFGCTLGSQSPSLRRGIFFDNPENSLT